MKELWRGIRDKSGTLICLQRCGSEYEQNHSERYYEVDFISPEKFVVEERKPKVKKWRWVIREDGGGLVISGTWHSQEEADQMNAQAMCRVRLIQKIDSTEKLF